MTTGDAAMASVLDELERVLVDIAASPSTLSQEDLDQVRRRIESKGLLFKVTGGFVGGARAAEGRHSRSGTGQRPLEHHQELRYDHDRSRD